MLTTKQVESPDFNHLGYIQADLHRRSHDEQIAAEHIKTRSKLIAKFTPFILYQDRHLSNVELASVVAERLLAYVKEELDRIQAAA